MTYRTEGLSRRVGLLDCLRLSQGDLYDQRYRIPEQRDPQGRQEAQAVPVRRFGQEGCLPGDHGCVKKMDHADPELEGSAEPVYH